MYWKYGSYQHPDNSVTLVKTVIRPKRSPRGRRFMTRVEIHCRGEVQANQTLTTAIDKQDDINTKMLAVEAAYSSDYQDAGFYRDDGDVTSHFLQNNHVATLTGNCVMYFHWEDSANEEFCSIRTFSFGIYAEFIDTYSGIYEYRDLILRRGTAGAVKRWRMMPNGVAIPRTLAPASIQTQIHMGKVVGLRGYIDPPPPLATGNFYLEDLTEIKRTGPLKFGYPGAYGLFTTEWKYIYQFPQHVDLYPTVG